MSRLKLISAWCTCLITIAFAIYIGLNLNSISIAEKLTEKVFELTRTLEIIADEIQWTVDTDKDWGSYNYDARVGHIMSEMDGKPLVYSAALKEDDDGLLFDISDRKPSYDEVPFDPRIFPEFMNAIVDTESGVVKVWWEANPSKGVPGRTMYVIYRWVPTGVSDPYLLVFAISKYTVDTGMSVQLLLNFSSFALVTGICGIINIFLWHRFYIQTKANQTGGRKNARD